MIWFALVLGLFNLLALVAFAAACRWGWQKAKPIVVPMLAMMGPPELGQSFDDVPYGAETYPEQVADALRNIPPV